MCEYCYRKIALCTSNCNDDPKKKESWKGMEIRVSGKIWKWQKSKTGIKLFWDEIPFKINGKKNLSSWESNLFKECKTNKRIFYLRKENKHMLLLFLKEKLTSLQWEFVFRICKHRRIFLLLLTLLTVNIIRGAVNKLCLEFICRFCFQPPI